MKLVIKLEEPKQKEFEMEATFTLDEWAEILKDLKTADLGSIAKEFCRGSADVIARAEKEYGA